MTQYIAYKHCFLCFVLYLWYTFIIFVLLFNIFENVFLLIVKSNCLVLYLFQTGDQTYHLKWDAKRDISVQLMRDREGGVLRVDDR